MTGYAVWEGRCEKDGVWYEVYRIDSASGGCCWEVAKPDGTAYKLFLGRCPLCGIPYLRCNCEAGLRHGACSHMAMVKDKSERAKEALR